MPVFAWQWTDAAGLVAGIVALTFALALFTSSRARANRRLALVLGFEGIGIFVAAFANMSVDPIVAARLASTTQVSLLLMTLAYLRFLALVPSPLAKPFGTRAAGIILATVGAAMVIVYVVSPASFIASVTPAPYGKWAWNAPSPPNLITYLYPLNYLAPIFALVVTTHAWRRATPGSLERRRMGSLAVGFGVRDGVFATVVTTALAVGDQTRLASIMWSILPAATLVGAPLIARAILRDQILGLELGVLADRLARREDTQARARRRREVYRLELAEALADGREIEKDPFLAELRRRLGLTLDDHQALLVDARPRPRSLDAQFEIVQELGRGGDGVAWLAKDRLLGRDVVLKRAHGDRDVLAEARAIARVQHPNVVVLYGVLAEERPPILVFEHVEGETLESRLAREGPLTEPDLARLARDLASGLARVHEIGIVHRDLKPANVLLAKDGTAKIADFGIAGASGEHAGAAGSPAFMSPEQRRGEDVDARSDIFSLGLVLETAARGRVEPSPLARPVELPAWLGPIVAGCTQSERARRYQRASDVLAALAAAPVAS